MFSIFTQLSLFDIVNTPGVAADLSHINTPAKVEGYLKEDDGLAKTLKGAQLVVIPAGVPRKPGVSTHSHQGFGLNACADTMFLLFLVTHARVLSLIVYLTETVFDGDR